MSIADAGGHILGTTQTNGAGVYSFGGMAGNTPFQVQASGVTYLSNPVPASNWLPVTTGQNGGTTTKNIPLTYTSPKSTISGKVTYNGGSGLSGQQVSLSSSDGPKTAVTDASGTYTFSGLSNNMGVTISVSYDTGKGIVSDTESRTTPASGGTLGVDINLLPKPVTVKGSVTYNGNGIGSVTVKAAVGASVYGTTTTVSDGTYSIAGLPGDADVTVTASYNGNTGTATGHSRADGAELDLSVIALKSQPTTLSVSGAASVVEGNTYTITLTRNGDNPSTFTVTYSFASSTGGSDYGTPSPASSVAFGASDTSKTITMAIPVTNTPRDITFTVTGPSNVVVSGSPLTFHVYKAGTPTATPTPAPGSSAVFAFQTVSGSATSGQVTVNVLRTNNLGSTNTVQIWISDASTAASGTDYTIAPAMPATLTFNPGVSVQSATITIPGGLPNGTTKTVVLLLRNPTGGAVTSYPDTYTLTIGNATVPANTTGNATITPTPTVKPTPTITATPSPTPATENTSSSWSWLLLLLLIPLAGIVIYYFAFVREK